MMVFKGLLYFQAYLMFTLVQAFRFFATILWGPDEAMRKCQAAIMEWAEDNGDAIGSAMRIMQSPVKVTLPDPPVPSAAPFVPVEQPAGEVSLRLNKVFQGAVVREVVCPGDLPDGSAHIVIRFWDRDALDLSAPILGHGIFPDAQIMSALESFYEESRCQPNR